MNEVLMFLMLAVPVFCSIPIALAWIYKPEAKWARKLPYLSVFGLFISLLIALYFLTQVPDGTKAIIYWLPDYNINFVFIFDYLSKYMGTLTALIAFLIGVYGLEYMHEDYRLGWYWFFFNLFTASMLMVVYSDNLLSLLIGWEGLGLASWALIGHWFRDDDELSFVGIHGRKVFINYWWPPSIGGWRAISTIRVGDMPMFFAVAAIYALTGTLDISQIPWHELFHKLGTLGTLILMICFLLGPLTKSAQVPFSEWLMTAMTGPTTVSALLHSATMVAAGTYVFMRITWYIRPWELHLAHAAHGFLGVEYIYIFMLFIGLISSLYGAFVAAGCWERKVLLAASTMSSLGLMFAATATSYWLGIIGIYVGFWYLMTHAFAKATLFLVAGHLIHVTHTRFSVGDLKLASKLKIACIITIIATLCLSGIPPLTAYWVKSAMDEVMHGVEHYLGYLPLIMLIITSTVYSGFLAKFLSMNFIKGERPHHEHIHGGGYMASAYTIMCIMLIVLLYRIAAAAEPVLGEFIEVGYKHSSFIIGLLVLVAYLIGLFKPTVKALSKIGTFLSDRMYMPFLNDLIVPAVGWFGAKIADYSNRGIDWFCHTGIPDFFNNISIKIRSIQTGYLRTYIKIVTGIVLVIFLIFSFVRW